MARWAVLAWWVVAQACVAVQAAPRGQEIEGTVAHVVDGDTVLLKRAEGPPLTLRLRGIDAPEICQPHGPQARQALEELVLGKPVVASTQAVDNHGRTIAVLRQGTIDVADRMVREGHAWSQRYKHDRGPYVMQERLAIALSRGLHATAGAVLPRHFRKQNGPCPRPPTAPAAPAAAPTAPPAAATAPPAAG